MGIDFYTMGQRIRKLRQQKNLTQEQLAELLDFSGRGYVSRVENGTAVMGLQTLASLAEGLGKPVSYLIDGAMTAQATYLYPELAEAVRPLSQQHRKAVVRLAESLAEAEQQNTRERDDC